jgi:trimethylamine:corrinoid methyltransferase-like protein
MILLAGKYLNVIRECGIEVEVPDAVGSDDGRLAHRSSRGRRRRRSSGARPVPQRVPTLPVLTPVFLEPWEDMILLAGKYLNVIRECGIEVEVPDAQARA